MRLSDLSEGRTSKVGKSGSGWEMGVEPSIYYIRRSDDPFRYWSPEKLVLAFTPLAKGHAKGVAERFGLDESDREDLVQTGLLGALMKIRELKINNGNYGPRGKPLSGMSLVSYIDRGFYNWMIQGSGEGEDWRSATSKDLRASKVRPPSDGPWMRSGRAGPVPGRAGPSSINRAKSTAVGLMRGLEDYGEELFGLDDREELEYVVDGLKNAGVRDVMRRFLGIVGDPPMYAKDLATEFGISPQAVGVRIKKGLREIQSILDEMGIS